MFGATMLVEALLETNRRCPRTLAVVDPLRSLTYARLTVLSAVIRRMVEKGTVCDRVGIMLPASSVFPATLFGVLWARRVAVPLNFLLTADELERVVRDADLDLVITVSHFRELCSKLPVRAIFLDECSLPWRVLGAMLHRPPHPPSPAASDAAVMLYTSGTTADPKGVVLSHGNLHSNCLDALITLDIRPPQVFLNILPPFHVFGLTANVLIPAVLGVTVVAIPRFNPVAAVKACHDHRVNVILAIPSMYAAILKTKSVKREDFASIELAVSGAEPLPDRVRDGFEERFGVTLREGYGLTETSPILSACSRASYRLHSVGRPIRNVQTRIVSPDGSDLPANHDGEIVVRGPGVMQGYFRRPTETAGVIDADGWFHTGDVGRLDSDGFLFITGRIKDMLIIGGENVFAREIEAVLEEHPTVLQSAVIGIPDELRGEAPVAFVVPREGKTVDEPTLRAAVKAKLAGYKVPKRVIIRDDLPTTPTGKILKRRLRDLL